MIREQIELKLKAALQPVYLKIVDESYRHNVPAGAESHFKVIIVSEKFSQQSILARHRLVYGILAAELAGAIHALALHTYSVAEWGASPKTIPASPLCKNIV